MLADGVDPRPRIPMGPSRTYLEISDRERLLVSDERSNLTELLTSAWMHDRAAILDVGAGQGWHSIWLSRRFDVTGIEPDPTLVGVGISRSEELASRGPSLIQGCAQRLPVVAGSFDLALSLNGSLGYGTRDDDRLAIDEMRRALKPGAPVILEFVSSTAAAEAGTEITAFGDGARLLRQPCFNPETSILSETETTLLPDGRNGSFRYTQHAYHPDDVLAMVRESGFRKIQLAGDARGTPWRPNRPIVLLASAPL